MHYIQRIKELRKEKKYNQTYVASCIEVKQTTYSDYERGRIEVPVKCLVGLARMYDVDMNFIAGISDERKEFPRE